LLSFETKIAKEKMTGLDITFFVLGFFLLASSALVAFRPRPIEAALWLILHFFLTSALYVLLGAHFVAVIQILVYAGAIVVLFTFVILLLNLNPEELGLKTSVSWASFVLFLAGLGAVFLCFHVATPELLRPMVTYESGPNYGTIESFSRLLLERYVWGFEVAGVILLLAVVGVGLLAHRKPRERAGS
jgi:NADH-quinone oxidoreductase subunit J